MPNSSVQLATLLHTANTKKIWARTQREKKGEDEVCMYEEEKDTFSLLDVF